MINNNNLMVSILLALVIIILDPVSLMTNAESQAPNTTSISIEDRIGMIMGNRITKMMDDTINMIKNVNSTAIVNQSENGITPVTNLTDVNVNKTEIRSTNELEKLAGNNIALTLDDISTDISNASMLEELEKSRTENATMNKQDTAVFERQNISSAVNTTENTSHIDQKIINDNTETNTTLYADNKTLATTTDKPTSSNNIGNFFTQIGESVKKFFGGN